MPSAKMITRPLRRRKALPLEKAYIAGLVDGKCILAITPFRDHQGYRELRSLVRFHNKDLGLLKMVQARYGGIIRAAYGNKYHEFTYMLEFTSSREIVPLMEDVYPYLLAKKKLANLLIKYCKSRAEAMQSTDIAFHAPITEEERKIAREFNRLKLSIVG